MTHESRLALRILLVAVAVVVVFAAGAWFGAKDRTCITASTPAADTMVVCRSGNVAVHEGPL